MKWANHHLLPSLEFGVTLLMLDAGCKVELVLGLGLCSLIVYPSA